MDCGTILTINVNTKNAEVFRQYNGALIDFADHEDWITVNWCSCDAVKSEYELFIHLLQNTRSMFTIMADDTSVFQIDRVLSLKPLLELADFDAASLKEESDMKSETYMTACIEGLITEEPSYLPRYVFKTDFLREITFSEEQKEFYKQIILLNIAGSANTEYFDIPCQHNERFISELDHNLYPEQYRKNWYTIFINDILSEIIHGDMNRREQMTVLYFILHRLYLNQGGRNKFVLDDEEIDTLFNSFSKSLRFVDDRFIISLKDGNRFNYRYAIVLLKWKYQGKLNFHVEKCNGENCIFLNDIPYYRDAVSTNITILDYHENKLQIDFEIEGDYCSDNIKEDFEARLNKDRLHIEYSDIYNDFVCFGVTLSKYTSGQVLIDVDQLTAETNRLEFRMKVGGKKIRTYIKFKPPYSRIIKLKYSNYSFNKYTLFYQKDNTLAIKKYSRMKKAAIEAGMIWHSWKTKREGLSGRRTALLRLLYWVTRLFYRQKGEIYIFFDKLYKAGDNAEYLFDYYYRNRKNVCSYYIVNKTSADYERLKKEYGRHIIEFSSTRQRLAVMNADRIFATHSNVMRFCGFNDIQMKYIGDLFNCETVCIQHGLTIQNLPQHQNRVKDNTREYFCASKVEIDNLMQPAYGYEREVLHLTGLPRFDGLINKDKKQILITPTWRRNIVLTGNETGDAKGYSPHFKETAYFRIYNKLVSDPVLIECAKKNGYGVMFLLHPTLSAQVDDFDKNDYVSIVPAVSDMSYEKVLTESSMMITDYSGVQFDFAYMKKPVLYYHPDELPPQYDEGCFKYNTMAFGPILKKYEDMVKTICEYIDDGCVMKEEYAERVDKFFAFQDHSNCERIAETIDKLG